MHGEAARRGVLGKLTPAEWQQRPNKSPSTALRDACEPRGCAATQGAQHDGFDLIVPMVRGHEVGRAPAALDLAQPGVARAPRGRLRRVRAEVQLAELEGQPVLFGEGFDRLSDRPPDRLDSVIRVRHDERQPQLRGDTV